jgi:hypothetical protein
MKNVTLSAPEELIEAARQRAHQEKTTLNAEFRQWLENYTQRGQAIEQGSAIIKKIGLYASSGGQTFSRDQMNER